MAQPTANFETITVARAKQLLAKNKNNRPLNQMNLRILMHDMKRNNFKITGESIKIAQNGDLLDGQHRLQAIVQSGIPLKTFIMEGIDNEAFKYIDTGKMRSASDVLAMQGITSPTHISAVGRFVMAFQQGKYFNLVQNSGTKKLKYTNKDVCDFVDKNLKHLKDSAAVAYNSKSKILRGSIIGGLHYIFKRINEEDANDFCHRLLEGDDLAKDSPIFQLRAEFIKNARSTRKMTPYEQICLICKAWNYYRKDTKVHVLKHDINDAFPKPI